MQHARVAPGTARQLQDGAVLDEATIDEADLGRLGGPRGTHSRGRRGAQVADDCGRRRALGAGDQSPDARRRRLQAEQGAPVTDHVADARVVEQALRIRALPLQPVEPGVVVAERGQPV
jgi:hypothetical protein